jgi:hypothetical protein
MGTGKAPDKQSDAGASPRRILVTVRWLHARVEETRAVTHPRKKKASCDEKMLAVRLLYLYLCLD